MQRNRKRMSPKVNGRLSSNYRHKHNSLFIHLLVHLFIQQTVMGFYIVTGSVRCVRIDGRAKLSPWPWGEDDGMRQWSCLTLGGYHLHVLDQLSALGGGSRGLTSFYPQGQWALPKSRDRRSSYLPTSEILQQSHWAPRCWRILRGIARQTTPSNLLSFSFIVSRSVFFSLSPTEEWIIYPIGTYN